MKGLVNANDANTAKANQPSERSYAGNNLRL